MTGRKYKVKWTRRKNKNRIVFGRHFALLWKISSSAEDDLLLPRGKSKQKRSTQKERWLGLEKNPANCQILTCRIATNYFYTTVKICILTFNQLPAAKPALTSLLRRGGLPLTFCSRAKSSTRLLSDHEGGLGTRICRYPAARQAVLIK